MNKFPSKIFENKIVIGVRDRIAESVDELFQSELFKELLNRFLDRLEKKQSPLLDIFGHYPLNANDRKILYETLCYLTKLDSHLIPNIVPGSEQLFADRHALNEFVEQLYNYWRSFDRFIICDSASESFDKRPYRTFNTTVERLTNLVRQAYRDMQENITAQHPRVYRQVHAGAEVATITVDSQKPHFSVEYSQLNTISIIRQVLIYPPLILEPPTNKRQGAFLEIYENPIKSVELDDRQWLCFPLKVGALILYVYFHESFYELGFALCNLFEMANDKDLRRKPDGIFLYGMEDENLRRFSDLPTVFYEDKINDLLVGAIPRGKAFGYFGYLKKMILTLHNLKVMQKGNLPFHGAFVQILLKTGHQANVLLIGDTGAGKSETLEALRRLGDEYIKDLTIIADDMGSLIIHEKDVLAYGTEIGAFLRLDDLQPGYAFGQLDRAIIMNASKTNARIVLPVTTYENITKGVPVDFIFYANNYENVDSDHPVIERFATADEAFHVFREGTVMSKGTTTTIGLVHSYFANIFGPSQRKNIHDEIAHKYFAHFFKQGIFVGQLRTRLGVSGFEIDGPRMAAEELLKVLLDSSSI
ncbi:MAG: phosphoenolpyruvate carboxykinase [Candidatus Neomarinimicrobiota bacterium]